MSNVIENSKADTDMGSLSTMREALGSLIGTFLPSGGLPDVLRILPTVELIGANNSRLGSAVLISPNWALTAAHCVCNLKWEFYVRSAVRDTSSPVPVDEVYWQNGDRASIPPSTNEWPEAAAAMSGDNDEIVLLHLDLQAAGVKPILPLCGYARMPRNTLPKPREFMLTSGFGEDEDGSFTENYPYVALMRYLGERSGWRGGCYLDPNVFMAGMARKFDSGAPIFLAGAQSSNPFLQLIGIHVCRKVAGPNDIVPANDEVAEFLPLTPAVQAWIKAITKGEVGGTLEKESKTEIATSEPNEAKGVRTTSEGFLLRNAYGCKYLANAAALDNGDKLAWCLDDVSSPNAFRTCDEVVIDSGSMTIYNNAGIGPLKLSPKKFTSTTKGFHCLHASAGDGTEYFVFQVASSDTGVRRIHIEVFAENSGSAKPSSVNILDGQPVSTVTLIPHCDLIAVSFRSSGGPRTNDQDDQGNGYEHPRRQ